MLQSRDCGATIGRMFRIGNSNLLDRAVEENRHALAFYVEGRVGGNPEDQLTQGVLVEAEGVGLAIGDQALGILHIRRKEEIKRSSILNLLSERSGRSEGKLDPNAGLLFVLLGDVAEGRIQVGSSRYQQLSLGFLRLLLGP